MNDFAGVIRPDARRGLEGVLRDLERRTGAEVALVTVDSVPDGDVERAAVDLVERWGIGKRAQDNGVLILCAVNQRRVRIEVGYGLEGILPDGKTGRIIDEHMLPRFRAGDMSAGLHHGTLAVARAIAANAGVTLGEQPLSTPGERPTRRRPTVGSSLVLLLMLVMMAILFLRNPRLFLLVMSMQGGRGHGYHRGRFGGGFGGFGGGLSGGGGATRGW